MDLLLPNFKQITLPVSPNFSHLGIKVNKFYKKILIYKKVIYKFGGLNLSLPNFK